MIDDSQVWTFSCASVCSDRLELLSSTSHDFGDPSVPVTPPSSLSHPLHHQHHLILWKTVEIPLCNRPWLKLHGFSNPNPNPYPLYHKTIHPPPPPSKPGSTRSFLTHATVVSSSRLLDYSTPPPTTTRRSPHLSSRFFTFSRRPTRTAIFPCHCATIPFPFCRQHAPNKCRFSHEASLFPLPLPSPSCRALPASDQELLHRSDGNHLLPARQRHALTICLLRHSTNTGESFHGPHD